MRKTRCNAKKPSCSFCEDLKIECIYSKPHRLDRPARRDAGADGVRPSNSSKVAVLERLGRIESALESLSNRSAITTAEPPRIPLSSTVNSSACEGYWPTVHSTVLSQQSLHGYKIPSMLVFQTVSPHYRRWAYDHLQEFYVDQLESISDMSLNLRIPTPPLDLSRSHLLRLQQAFVTSVLGLFPVVDPETCLKQTKLAADSGYEDVNSSVCFALLVYAVGSCAKDSVLYEVGSCRLPGFPYFTKAMAILEILTSPVIDLSILQCRVLIV